MQVGIERYDNRNAESPDSLDMQTKILELSECVVQKWV